METGVPTTYSRLAALQLPHPHLRRAVIDRKNEERLSTASPICFLRIEQRRNQPQDEPLYLYVSRDES